jgi:hypothetical protein
MPIKLRGPTEKLILYSDISAVLFTNFFTLSPKKEGKTQIYDMSCINNTIRKQLAGEINQYLTGAECLKCVNMSSLSEIKIMFKSPPKEQYVVDQIYRELYEERRGKMYIVQC